MSGVVRDAFIAQGIDATSVDILPSLRPGPHIQEDLWELNLSYWDAVIAFPPCTHLAVSGARYFAEKRADGRQQEGVDFFLQFTKSKKPWAIENPVGIMSSHFRKPDQIIQPWQFGHGETKATCLWLNGLPKLIPTDVVSGREQRIWKLPPTADRAMLRSLTFQGIADAMAAQWAPVLKKIHAPPETYVHEDKAKLIRWTGSQWVDTEGNPYETK